MQKLDLLPSEKSVTHMGGAFQEKLVGRNGPLTGCSAMLRYKNKKLNAEMSTNVTVLHD